MVFLLNHGDGRSRSPFTTIPHTGPLDVCNVVPGAHLAGCTLADLVVGPADAIAITPTVRPATVNTDPNSRDRDRPISPLSYLSLSLTEPARRAIHDQTSPPRSHSALSS